MNQTVDIDPVQLERLTNDVSGEETVELYARGLELYQNGMYDAAMRLFQVLAMAKPKIAQYWMALGATCQMLKDYHSALRHYAVAGILEGNNPSVHFHAAECLLSIREKTEGLSALRMAQLLASGKKEHAELLERIQWLQSRWGDE